ncbi:MAG: LCP family protein [Christensenellales bacterium]
MNDQIPTNDNNSSDGTIRQDYEGFPDTSIKQEQASHEEAPNANVQGGEEASADNAQLGQVPVNSSYYESKIPAPKKPNHKMIVLFSVLGAFLLLLAVGAIILNKITKDPSSYFDSALEQLTPAPTRDPSKTPDPQEPSPTINPYDALMAQADTSILKDVFNVLIIGVDYAPERETWEGKHAYHADVMLVLAINIKNNTVDMISLPRDTYAKIPGVDGIYKLNASLDCGGGYPTTEGFSKVCEAASWMLGGIPVQYYYAVDMPVVKKLVDAIGGIEYDIDVDFTMVGRSYTKGLKHLDGQGVLDYLRVRKDVEESGDLNRINRQKKMLIALFKSMQERNLITQIPSIISSFEGEMYTNTSVGQTAALAMFAYNLPADNIQMHSMTGRTKTVFDWLFCLTDQKKRVQLIFDVYGVKVDQYSKYTFDYASWLSADMRSTLYLETVQPLIKFVNDKIAQDDLLPTPTPIPTPTPDATAEPPVTITPLTEPTVSGSSLSGSYGSDSHVVLLAASPTMSATPPQYRQYSPELRAAYQAFLAQVETLRTAQQNKDTVTMESILTKTFESQAANFAKQFGYTKKLVWLLDYETTTNEVKVDFR